MHYKHRLHYPLSLILLFSFFPGLIVAGVIFLFLSVNHGSFITTTAGQFVLVLVGWFTAALMVFLTTGIRITLSDRLTFDWKKEPCLTVRGSRKAGNVLIPCSTIDSVTITELKSQLWREFKMADCGEQEPVIGLAGYTGPAISVTYTARSIIDKTPKSYSVKIPCREPEELLLQLNRYRKTEVS